MFSTNFFVTSMIFHGFVGFSLWTLRSSIKITRMMETEHSLERIFLTLSDSCPLPVGWACLRQPDNERNILFAHVTVDSQLKVECDRTILLTVSLLN